MRPGHAHGRYMQQQKPLSSAHACTTRHRGSSASAGNRACLCIRRAHGRSFTPGTRSQDQVSVHVHECMRKSDCFRPLPTRNSGGGGNESLQRAAQIACRCARAGRSASGSLDSAARRGGIKQSLRTSQVAEPEAEEPAWAQLVWAEQG
jgi:hypothetical protein